ncbi:MAG TPA: LysR family transcriptional regulator [Acetobacteraceae bacterium]|nr:LysR family transcriptional regulator [Acetobacteraceae bacterium]
MDLNDVAVFVRVAELGSFSQAARSLGMPISTASRKVAELERQLGVSLLQRTTRKLTLTAQGREFHDHCSQPLADLYDAEKIISRTQRTPQGLLRITVPVIMGREPFMDFVSSFLQAYPRIRISLLISNAAFNLVSENMDLAINFGQLEDSSFIARKLGTTIRYLVATPGYLKGRPLPAAPPDLARHDCLVLHGRNNEADWHLVSGRRSAKIRVTGPISSSDFQSLSEFTYRGHGIGLLPSTYCEQQIAKSELIRVLPEWTSAPIPVYAVYATQKFMPAKLEVFLSALASWKSPLWSAA